MKNPKIPLVAGILCLIVATNLFSACSRQGDSKNEKPESNPMATVVSLENTEWTLIELNGVATTASAGMMPPTIHFDGQSLQVSGNSGINRFGGKYQLDGDKVEFGPMRSTMMAGPPEAMELEATFLKALSEMTSWRIHESRLEFLKGDGVIARFSSKPAVTASITGSVIYRERIALAPEAVLEVTLADVSLADAPARVIAQYTKANPGNPPMPFTIEYDRSAIDERASYSVSAKITAGGKLMFISDTVHPVITRGAGNEVEILVRRSAG